MSIRKALFSVVAVSVIAVSSVSCGQTVERFQEATIKSKMATALRGIQSFEQAFLAEVAVTESEDISKIGLSDLIIFEMPQDEWFRFDVGAGGTITATSKVNLGNVAPGATLVSTYNGKNQCFERTIDPRLAQMAPSFVSDCK